MSLSAVGIFSLVVIVENCKSIISRNRHMCVIEKISIALVSATTRGALKFAKKCYFLGLSQLLKSICFEN